MLLLSVVAVCTTLMARRYGSDYVSGRQRAKTAKGERGTERADVFSANIRQTERADRLASSSSSSLIIRNLPKNCSHSTSTVLNIC